MSCPASVPEPSMFASRRPLSRRGFVRMQCRAAGEIAGTFLNVDVRAIMALRRHRASATMSHARHVAVYLANVTFQLNLAEVADGFGCDRSSVSYALARVEDRRDDLRFDAELARMERMAELCRRLIAQDLRPEGIEH